MKRKKKLVLSPVVISDIINWLLDKYPVTNVTKMKKEADSSRKEEIIESL